MYWCFWLINIVLISYIFLIYTIFCTYFNNPQYYSIVLELQIFFSYHHNFLVHYSYFQKSFWAFLLLFGDRHCCWRMEIQSRFSNWLLWCSLWGSGSWNLCEVQFGHLIKLIFPPHSRWWTAWRNCPCAWWVCATPPKRHFVFILINLWYNFFILFVLAG